MRRVRWAVFGAGLLALCLACSGGTPGRHDVKAPRGKKPAEPTEEGPKSHWMVDGTEVKGDALVGAVMDLWGGDPGPICFTGEAKYAARRAKKSFEGNDKFVSAKEKGKDVVITTKSPFGDDETSDFSFSPCP